MRNTLYYGEIADKISNHLCKNPNHLNQIDRCLSEGDPSETIWTVVSEATHIFENIEDLADQSEINASNAIEEYSHEILDHLLVGHKPNTLNLIDMASRSIQATMQ